MAGEAGTVTEVAVVPNIEKTLAEGAKVVADLGKPPETPVVDAGAAGAKTEKKAHRLDHDGEIPKDADLLELSAKALASRIARGTKAELKSRFGTDDAEQIVKDLAELKELREGKEKERLAKLSEIDAEKEARARAESRATAAEAKATRMHEQRIVEREDKRMRHWAAEVFDPDHIPRALSSLARHFRALVKEGTYTEKALDKMAPAEVKKIASEFFAERVKAKPKHAKDYEQQLAAKIKADIKEAARIKAGGKAPVTNGSKGNDRASADASGNGGNTEGKSMRPGQPNSMTSAEARAAAKKEGVSWM